jgi:hypothetical protein
MATIGLSDLPVWPGFRAVRTSGSCEGRPALFFLLAYSIGLSEANVSWILGQSPHAGLSLRPRSPPTRRHPRGLHAQPRHGPFKGAEAGPTRVESFPSFQLCVLMEVMGVVGNLLHFFGHIGHPPEGPCYHLGDMWHFWRHGSRDGHMDSRQHWYQYLAAVLERPMLPDLTNPVEEYLQAVPREYSKD